MASIHKLPSGRYRVRYRPPGEKNARSYTCDTREEALDFVADFNQRKRAGTWTNTREFGKRRLGDWIAEVEEGRMNLVRSTRDRDDSLIRNHIATSIGTAPIASITRPMIQSWLAGLQRSGLSPATVAKVMQVVTRALTEAVNRQLLQSSPAAGIKPPRAPKTARTVLRPEEVEELIKTIDPHYRLFVEFLALTGIRIGEAAAVTVRDVAVRERNVRITRTLTRQGGLFDVGEPKTESSNRTVGLPKRLCAALDAHIAERHKGQWLFDTKTGKRIRTSNFRRRYFSPAAAAVRVPWATPHDLRHFYATQLLHGGLPVPIVSQQLGHSSPAVTMRIYAHVMPDSGHLAADYLDNLFESSATAENA